MYIRGSTVITPNSWMRDRVAQQDFLEVYISVRDRLANVTVLYLGGGGGYF
jgi:hypothetical protein